MFAKEECETLSPVNYRTKFENSIYEEEQTARARFRRERPDLLNKTLRREGSAAWIVDVPKLNKDGGPVNVRTGSPIIMCKAPNGLDNRWNSTFCTGHVVAVDLRNELIKLKFRERPHGTHQDRFNIRIELPSNNYQRIHKSIVRMSHSEKFRQIMFPDPGDKLSEPLISLSADELEDNLRCFTGVQLDLYQRKAVINALQCKCRPAPYLIFGPPATGKTTTLVELTLQIFRRRPALKILVCANSDKIAHLLAVRLKETGHFAPGDLIRLIFPYLRSRKSYEEHAIPSSIRDICVEVGHVSDFKVVVSSVKTANDFHHSGLGNCFDYVIIDDAQRTIEPEVLIPLSLVKATGCIVMAGDVNQLGPPIENNDRGLGCSLLERLSKMEAYKLTSANEHHATQLLNCYRCDPRIMAVSNELFYNERVQCMGELSSDILLSTLGLLKPLVFHAVHGQESGRASDDSWVNRQEAEVCLQYVKFLIQFGYDLSKIGVVVPYNYQSELISELFERNGVSGCGVDKIEAYYGRERDVMIISTVHERPLENHLLSERRFNESITRAKALVIVVGHPLALKSRYWLRYMESAQCVSALPFAPKSNLRADP